ncbi:hypothetical protein [Aurantiacibacter gangjinensis]|uniref:Uncharacterized protein n=1 Tax=Aurantiacibacter gangjinensis TaxID=502682 RepID=A0A0G9MS34_9SPHN|nr:hypothetical protein [Aurantiacibacter gangjinensis]APE27110.1 hypothetical protein BMF35_a0281 [Aurantiacibacter gangjinensis]KLE33525.1 hypothetical protein AAW01_06390 [Aurantiacibacter gangjinensis]
MTDTARQRGWPLFSLALLLGGWILLRAALWEAPFDRPLPLAFADLTVQAPAQPVPRLANIAAGQAETPIEAQPPASIVPGIYPHTPLERPDFERRFDLSVPAQTAPARGGMRQARMMLAHAALLQRGYREGAQPVPYRQDARPIAGNVAFAPAAAERFANETREKRWGFDAWALWRDDTTTPVTSGRPSYGRSQAGAVLRYHLAPGSGHAPLAYARFTRALQGGSETEGALGLSARPLPSVPVRLAAEARVSETDAGTELRGAAYAVTELPRVTLPAGFEGEAYLQGGYVSGAFATAFADGQARITRPVAISDDFRLEAGAGAWGGAQEDAYRVDVGPTAGATISIGQARARISADYRFRVAGDAEPASGPTLTVSAGF